MYQAYECMRCGYIFNMTDERRKEFVKSGGCVLKCPKCECYGLDELKLGKYCSGCINPKNGRFLSCVDCTFEPLKYNCNAWKHDVENYHILTMDF